MNPNYIGTPIQNQGLTQNALSMQRSQHADTDIPSVPDTVQNLVNLISQQAAELYQRSLTIADVIGGTLPQNTEKSAVAGDGLLYQLRFISQALGHSLSELERAQGNL